MLSESICVYQNLYFLLKFFNEKIMYYLYYVYNIKYIILLNDTQSFQENYA